MRGANVFFALLVLPAALAAQQDPRQDPRQDTSAIPTVTLDQAVALALEVQPAVVQALGDLRAAGAARREAVGNWLPDLSLSSGWNQRSTEQTDPTTGLPVSGAATSYSAGLNASLELFDGFRRPAQNRAAGANLDNAEAQLVDQRFQVVLQTKQAFFNALAGEELVRVAQTRIQRAEEQLKISRDKLAAGSATRADTLQSTVELANAQLQLVNAETQMATASASLARLMGYDGAVRAVGDSSLLVLSALDTAALRVEVVDNAPSVLAAEASARAAGAQVAVSRAQYFPTLSASYSNSYSGRAIDQLTNNWSMRLSVNWPLFNGFTRESNSVRASASADVARARADDARRQAQAAFTQFVASLRAAQARRTIAQVSRAAAEENLRVQRERYRLGAATIVEVLTAQVNLDQAETDLITARFDFLVARAQLEALLGREL